MIPRCRRCSCGATNRRSATCLACRRTASANSPRCACASAARSRWSEPRPRTNGWSSATARPSSNAGESGHDFAIDLPMDVLFGKPPKMHRDTARPPAPRWPELATDRARPARRRAARARAPDRRVEILPGHHRRPHRRRPDRARPDGRPVAAAGGRLRDHAVRFRWLRRRSDGDRRTHAAGVARPCRGRAHGGGRGDHQPVRRAGRDPASDQAVGELDGRRRPPRRRRAPVRRGQGGRHGAVPGTRPEHSGRQGFAVDAGAVARRRRRAEIGVAGVADRHRVRAGGRHAHATHAVARARGRQRALADRPRRRQAASSAARSWRSAIRRLRRAAMLRQRRIARIWRRRAGPRRSATPARVLRTDPRRARSRPAARLPRPFRRRRLRHVVRNGVLLARWASTSASMAGATIRSARCSTRNSARWCRSRPRIAPSSPTWSRATA